MPTPTNRAAYGSYFDLLDRALDTEMGVRIECQTQGEAYQHRTRLHTARKIDRKLNRESRDIDDPNYGVSDYDKLIVSTRTADGKWWVYIKPVVIPSNIEVLTCKSDANATSPTPGQEARSSSASSAKNSSTPILPLGLTKNTR